MRAVVQRIYNGSVKVEDRLVSEITRGLLVYLGVKEGDEEKDMEYLAEKVSGLRIYEDDQGKMNLSVKDKEYEIMVISQFTLYGDVRKGKRPSFTDAARPEEGRRLYEAFVKRLQSFGFEVATGEFGAHMEINYTNDGPVTILLDSEKVF
ncbi:MAG: D-tyrosyl-tRNA(Tyr) deacylase [Tissierellia bacterium]|nr:D-tyrosyl-tRNA(Tyr) deacylase [Tissierellia bacterium]